MVHLVLPTDALYLWGESTVCPSHVIGLQIFRPPAGSGVELLERLYADMTDESRLKPAFRRRAYRSARTGGQYAWSYDQDVDLTLQVRRVALPSPGRMRELLDHVSAWHAIRLSRDRPLWEAQLVEGLDDGRFAVLTKMHHSMFDGVTMGRHLLSGLSPDPEQRGGTAPWIVPTGAKPRPRRPTAERSLLEQARTTAKGVGRIAGSARTLASAGISAARERRTAVPFSAPHTIFNGSVSTARRFAGQGWPAARLKDVATRAGVSPNDVALAMCGGALREYLLEQDALPHDPLVAMVPISFRPRTPDADDQEGNSWGAILCELATEISDPEQRLRRINNSMLRSKNLMTSLDPVTAALVSAGNLGGAAIQGVPNLPRLPRPPFNLVISNVPSARQRLYLDGCEMTDAYPVSVVTQGQALNITLVSYVDTLGFGVTGCRRSVPHLQRFLPLLEESLQTLEKTF
jgi:diacylglycerol O-acyltransferase / wax synthase